MAEKGRANMKQAQCKKMTIQSTIKTDLVTDFHESDKVESLMRSRLRNIFPDKEKVKKSYLKD